MKLIYARNCDMFYDEENKQIIFSKRGKYFVVKAEKQVLQQMKEIMCDFLTEEEVEQIVEHIPNQEKKSYLSYLQFMLNRNILVEYSFQKEKLSDIMQDYLIANHNADKNLIHFWENVTLYSEELNEEVILEIMKYGVSFTKGVPQNEADEHSLVIGNFSEKKCEELLKKGYKVLLFREEDDSVYLMLLNHLDHDQYSRYQSFVCNRISSFYAKNLVVAFQIISHCSEQLADDKSQRMLCVAGDGTLHKYNIGKLYEESESYFNRSMIPAISEEEFVTKAEKMGEIVPFLVKGCNQTNYNSCQSPISNYEVDFGEDFKNEIYVAYDESYKKAAKYAFENGFEKVLNKNGEHHFRCATSLNEYYIKGYISLLPEVDECYEVRVQDADILNRIHFLEATQNIKLTVYYVPSPVDGVGRVILADDLGRIVYEGQRAFRMKEQIMHGLYAVIGLFQTGYYSEHISNVKNNLWDRYDIKKEQFLEMREISDEEVKENLIQYFEQEGRIIDEKIWAYQAQMAEFGLHVGEFYFVR